MAKETPDKKRKRVPTAQIFNPKIKSFLGFFFILGCSEITGFSFANTNLFTLLLFYAKDNFSAALSLAL
ncbi:hypothetical protein CHY_2077 [Carboxydothermus hydrogenoformans Z-2901]|uniref:Uncharacterized protein n=1 Tax=Carboxydothermus hydrogenoformans (strain ATCC BAA-161 / DSM 6008 / Z-2901) TaxID=246194 RepID=Q3AAD8_CARHZ|nr:hypothetical protein CHY_2077 [Carboxydothermus hydrogenoformans Z-2901]